VLAFGIETKSRPLEAITGGAEGVGPPQSLVRRA
jgi:hypothetical protein